MKLQFLLDRHVLRLRGGSGLQPGNFGTYLIPYPNGNTPWGFAYSTASCREAKEPVHPGGGVVAHLCQSPIQVQYTYETFAVSRGYGPLGGCESIFRKQGG